MKTKLSKKYCDEATYQAAPPYGLDVRWDESIRGFGLRLYPGGKKAWVILYQSAGRRRWLTLGLYEHLTLEEARRKAKAELGRVAGEGADPQQEKQRARLGETVADLVALYLKEWASRKRTGAADKRQLEKDVVPAFGARRIVDVTRQDVREMLERVKKRGPVSANRLLAVTRKMFNFAIDRDLLEHSPCERLRLQSPETPRARVLGAEEIKTLWSALSGGSKRQVANSALLGVLVTGQRPGELAGMRWEEVEGDWWTIPSGRSKNALAHRVPLSALALGVLGERRKGYVFGDGLTVRALPHFVSVNKCFGLPHWTPHDLRRTAASHMARIGVDAFVVDRVLNHKLPRITGTYNLYGYDAEKREALERWAVELGRITAPAQ